MKQLDITRYKYTERYEDSKSKPGTKHVVQTVNGIETCTCPGYFYHGYCKHVDKPLPVYYNTTAEHDPELGEYMESAKGQELEVLRFFYNNKGKLFTPAEVHSELKGVGLLTSVRRAMTNLTKRGFLEKTDVKKKGLFDRSNFCWRLKEWVI